MTLSLIKVRSSGRTCAVLLSPCTDTQDLCRLLSPRFELGCTRLLQPPDFSVYSVCGKERGELDLVFGIGAYLYARLGASRYDAPHLSARIRAERLSLTLHERLLGTPVFARRVPLGARILPFDLLALDRPYAVSFFHALPLSRVPLAEWGTRISHSPLLPLHTRAVFCEYASGGALSLRVWDGEEGELPSSITAAAATLHLSLLRGMISAKNCVTVRTRGGAVIARASRVLGETHIDTESHICFEARMEI